MKTHCHMQVHCPLCGQVMASATEDLSAPLHGHVTCLNSRCAYKNLVFEVPALEIDIELTTKVYQTVQES